MSYKDIYNVVSLVQSLAPAARTNGTVDGTATDRQFSDSLLAIIDAGLWTDGVHTITLQDSDDNVTFGAVASGSYQGTNPVVIDANTEDNMIYKIGYLGTKRYVRLSTTVSGATTGAVYGGVLEKSHLRFAGAHELTPAGQ